jgi:acetyl esterase/lipase
MDFLSKIQGTELPEICTPTFAHFIPHLLRNPLIQKAEPKTYQYGPFPSQKLDIYTPPAGTKPAGKHPKPPVFIFYYGGGYMAGRKQMPLLEPQGQTVYVPVLGSLLCPSETDIDREAIDRLYHQNIGTFIASRGFVAVIPDYRLVNMGPEHPFDAGTDARFPSGAEDVALSMRWAVQNLSDVGDTQTVFAMGHSAGANHLATAMLLPGCVDKEPELMRALRKWVTLSATFDYVHSREQRRVAWSRYFGGFERIGERCPTALVRALEKGGVSQLPELLCLHAKRDHFGAVDPQKRFWDLWIEKGGRGEMEEVNGKEHNHMSTIYSVGCGDKDVERWLVDVLEWCLGEQ